MFGAMQRAGRRYWGPALIVIGVMGAGIAIAALRDFPLYWMLAISAVVVLSGITLIASTRIDDD